MGKRYIEQTKKESPHLLGLGPDAYHTTVTDTKTGERGEGWSRDKGESIDRAWKDLREKQGK